MVTAEEARTQLAAQRKALQQRQQEIKAIGLRALTRAEVGKQTRESMLQRKQQEQSLETQKQQALETLKPIEKQFETTEQEIKRVEAANVSIAKEQSEWELARKLIIEGKTYAARDAPSVRSKIATLREAGVGAVPVITTKKIGTLPAFKNILTGEIIYQSIAPKNVPTFYQPIQVSRATLKEVGFTPQEQLMASLGIQPSMVEPIEPVGVVKDIKKPPTIVDVPPTIGERVGFQISKTLTKAEVLSKEFAEKAVAVTTIPSSVAKEETVTSIKLPSIPGTTQVTRPVSFQDVDTGVLPPMQNLELRSTKILTDFSLGNISETKALEGLEDAQKQYVLSESKRTAALRFAEGAGIGALTVLAPPIGYTLIGLSGADALAKRREIVAFAKINPKAAAIQFAAGVAGGLVGAGGVSAVKSKSVTFREPTVKLVGKARIKLINNILKNLEPKQRVEFAVMKKTATRAFLIDIPSPKGKITLKVLEFTKGGKKMFAGLEFVNGKVRTGVGGLSLVKGKGGDARIITRSIRTHTKKGLTNLEVAEYLEKVSTKAVKSKGLRSTALTEGEVRLAKMFELKGLTPAQIREILRRPLFGTKEAQRRISTPFTDAEFRAASKLSKSRVIISRDIVKTRLTSLNEQLGPLIAERDIVDVRVIERGMGSVDIQFNLPKPTFKIKPKVGEVRVPGKISGVGIEITKLKKADIPKMPRRTPLSRTFTDETKVILQQRVSPAKKVKLLQKLRKDVSPVGAFKEIAKRIQKERINLAIKQAQGKAAVVGVVTGLKVTPKTKALVKQKQLQLVKQLSKQKDGVSIAQVTPSIVKQAEVLALAGKITQVQLQTLKSKLILKERIVTPTKVPLPLITPPPIIRLPKGTSKTKTIQALLNLREQGVDIITGLKERKKKILRKNLPPFKALKFGREFVDRNIEASFKLVPSGKKAKGKDIPPFNVGLKFRPSKTNPLFLVEKKKYRLDTPTELAQLLRAKRTAPKKKVKRRRK